MKRSDMLKIMFKCADAHDGFVGCDIHFVNETMLTAIESAGMLPPCLNLASGGDFTKDDCQEMASHYEGHFEWEEISYGEENYE